MTSERQREANRANAKKSTGPRSRDGKYRASRNAYRHGLSARASWRSERSAELAELTREIVESSNHQITAIRAREIAKAMLDVRRVRSVETALVAHILNGHTLSEARSPSPSLHPEVSGSEDAGTLQSLERAIAVMQKIDRYHRQASAKRARAMRNALDGDLGDNLQNEPNFFEWNQGGG